MVIFTTTIFTTFLHIDPIDILIKKKNFFLENLKQIFDCQLSVRYYVIRLQIDGI